MDVHPADCSRCAAYEKEVMGRGTVRGEVSDTAFPEELAPCEGYMMSDSFRDWVVERMRADVAAQVGGSGLDRMAILKRS